MSSSIRWHFLIAGLALLALLLLAACSGLAGEPQVVATLPPEEVMSQAQPVQPPAATEEAGQAGAAVVPPDADPDTVLGARIYAENCTRCHGVNGEGDGEMVKSGQVTMPIDFTDPATSADATPEQWYEIVTNGRLDKLMPPWKDKLTDEERWAVTNYVYNLPQTFEVVKRLVSGQVVNGTANAVLPPDLTATLHIVDEGFTREDTLEAPVAADGTFRFEDVPMRSNRSYVVTTDYKDTIFASDLQAGDPSAESLDLPVMIYEFTDDPSVVTIGHITAQVSIDPDNKMMQVVESVSFENQTDKAYQGEDGTSVHLTSPEGAQFTQFLSDSNRYTYDEETRQMRDTYPVIPGQSHTVHLMYSLPYEGSAEVRRPLDYPVTDGFEILVGTPGITIEGDGIEPFGGRDTAHGTLMSFGTRNALPSGGEMRFTVSGMPQAAQPATPAAPTTTIPPLGLAFIALGVLAIGAAGVLYVKERHAQAQPALAVPASDLQTRINTLVHEIAALDMAVSGSKTTNKAQQKRRAELKAELMALIKQQEKGK